VINQGMGGYHGNKIVLDGSTASWKKRTMQTVLKKRNHDFSRKRKTTFKKLMWFMLSMVKESSRNALERFFSKIKEVTL
jgi:hypothetical protein